MSLSLSLSLSIACLLYKITHHTTPQHATPNHTIYIILYCTCIALLSIPNYCNHNHHVNHNQYKTYITEKIIMQTYKHTQINILYLFTFFYLPSS